MLRALELLLLSAFAAFAGPIYSVSVIQVPAGLEAVEMDGINNSGEVSGFGFGGTDDEPFIASPSGSALIPYPSGSFSAVVYGGINNLGQVTGQAYNGSSDMGFVGSLSGSAYLPLPTGWAFSFGGAINDSGTVAGSGVTNASAAGVFVGTASGTVAIPLPSGWDFGAEGINNVGQVVGYGPNQSSTVSFIGTSAGATILPLVSGFPRMAAYSINDSGEVAGIVAGLNGCSSASPSMAFIGGISEATLIPLPTGANCAQMNPGSINDAGVVVGSSEVGAWIWTASDGTQLLSSIVPTGWTIPYGFSISQNGLILAWGDFDGGTNEFIELSPIAPEPSTLLLCCFALLGLLALTRLGSTSGIVPNNTNKITKLIA